MRKSDARSMRSAVSRYVIVLLCSCLICGGLFSAYIYRYKIFTIVFGSLTQVEFRVDGKLLAYQRIQLSNLVRQYFSRAFPAVDIQHLQSEIRQLDWVEDLTVRRLFHQRLEVNIVKRLVLAACTDYHHLVTVAGRVIKVKEPRHDLALLVMDLDECEMGAKVYTMLVSKMSSVGLTIKSGKWLHNIWHLEMYNGMKIVVHSDGMSAKISRFISIYNKLPRSNLIRTINLNYFNGIAVQWSQN